MKEFKCFYCNQFCLNDEEHIAHIDAEHARKLHYPTPADFEEEAESTSTTARRRKPMTLETEPTQRYNEDYS